MFYCNILLPGVCITPKMKVEVSSEIVASRCLTEHYVTTNETAEWNCTWTVLGLTLWRRVHLAKQARLAKI